MPAPNSAPPRPAEAKPAHAGPGAQAQPLSPVDNLASIAASAQAISNSVNNILRAGGARIGLADWSLLQRLAASAQPLPMGRLARQMGVTRQRIQKQVDELIAGHLVGAETAAEDKRVRVLSLTGQGREALAATSRIWAQGLSKGLTKEPANLDGVRKRLAGISAMLVRLGNAELVAELNAKKKAGPGARPADAASRRQA